METWIWKAEHADNANMKRADFFKDNIFLGMDKLPSRDDTPRVQLRGNVITINVYGFEHQAAAASILTNLDGKLSRAKIDPRIPWLGNRRLQFLFY